ncbi:HlyD family secretion protein [Mixta tenebrionis]|uniref:HlyD family efflux transporter periplasmic adaptor subunit n=1 Tax=Mixta tenebrionis TaxID=2562439 RepID=A0A506V4I2_9GAMM|nr:MULTISPECIES: HlyD family efflux transporter periplasmic adaptor subunit [Mixta]QHM77630.1 p-hydroxybenzoic acid efflux pump subunit AaeA [Mixta theicola]TPW40565.1 HlyD family efflux transporter periplasmic adaptor subunit [Mixta tenebrionis]
MLNNKLIIFLCCLTLLSGCKDAEPFALAGYTYGEFTYLSFPFTEEVEELFVAKGETVSKGQKLMQMVKFTAENALHVAEKNVLAEQALLHNLETGERQAALNMVRAQLERAKSAASLAKRELERQQRLYKAKMVSVAEWERAKEDYIQKKAQVKELLHQLEVKELPAREAEINNQKSRVESAVLQRDKARWDLEQRTLFAPQDALVYDILYHPGERPAADRPVISLLSPDRIKIRFYVPEKRLGEIQTGTRIKVHCDGCSRSLSAYINYISPQAEFSPPVIYSTQRREKLLFMAEAVPVKEDLPLVKTGQPVAIEVVSDE